MGSDSATSLAPGFRFHPTDEEIVRYYLRRKVSGKSLRFDPISVTEIYKSEPWDLPGKLPSIFHFDLCMFLLGIQVIDSLFVGNFIFRKVEAED